VEEKDYLFILRWPMKYVLLDHHLQQYSPFCPPPPILSILQSIWCVILVEIKPGFENILTDFSHCILRTERDITAICKTIYSVNQIKLERTKRRRCFFERKIA
jgi:hypothetical protein